MKSVVMTVLVLFLIVNVGVLYYIVLFGDVPEMIRRLDVVERRIDGLVDDKLNTPSVPKVSEEDLIVLTDQQKEELADMAVKKAESEIGILIEDKLSGAVKKVEDLSGNIKVMYAPIGTASIRTSDNNWRDVPVEVDINLANYGKVVGTRFEATLRVPSGNGQVQVRLVDTRNGLVGGTELSGESAGGVFVKSGPVSIQPGDRTLRVQMRTSLDYEGIMENARLRLVLE